MKKFTLLIPHLYDHDIQDDLYEKDKIAMYR